MRICEWAGCENELTRRQRRFCSAVCSGKSGGGKFAINCAERKVEKDKLKEHPCENCGDITIKPKYCSKSCAAKYNNHVYPKRHKVEKPPKESKSKTSWAQPRSAIRPAHPCFGCGVDTLNKVYCSISCPRIFAIPNRIKLAKETGELPKHYEYVKPMIEADRGFGCEICGITEWLGLPILLILDHIDGNSDNHVWSNVRTICSNCDAQLPTYKAKNKGNGSSRCAKRYAKIVI